LKEKNKITIYDLFNQPGKIKWDKEKLKQMRRELNNIHRADKRAVKKGRELASKVMRGKNRSKASLILAGLMDEMRERDDTVSLLTLEWAFEKYWAFQVEKHLPVFDETYEKLKEIGAKYNDRVVWGDIDCGAWIEPDKRYRVIGLEIYCALRDDNTYLFIDDKISDDWRRFSVRTCWPREKKNKFGYGVDQASVHTYRRSGWDTHHGDTGFTYERISKQSFGKVDHIFYHPDRVYWALWNLSGILGGITDHPLELPKGKSK